MAVIADDFAATLPFLQAQAESTMVTPCRVRRPAAVTPDSVTSDPETGADVDTYELVPSGGRCKVQTREGQTRLVESGQGSVTVQVYEVHLPVASGPYRIGDVIDILDRPDSPEAVVVRRFHVDGRHDKTWQTAQRLPVTETPTVALT